MQTFSVANLLIGLLIAAAGVVGIKYTFQIVNLTGRQDWIEHITGQGTTYFVYKMFFLAVALYGVLLFTGLGVPFTTWLLSPLKRVFAPLG